MIKMEMNNMDKFVEGLKLGGLEISSVTEKTVMVTYKAQKTRLKKRVSEYGQGEYIVLDLNTLNWLGITTSVVNPIEPLDCAVCKELIGFRNKFKKNEIAYRLFAHSLSKVKEGE